jgi:hypothetical protein
LKAHRAVLAAREALAAEPGADAVPKNIHSSPGSPACAILDMSLTAGSNDSPRQVPPAGLPELGG